MNNDFSPMSDISFEIKYYLFGNDILIKTIDGEEYLFDKITEEWLYTNLLRSYREKNITPKELSEEEARKIISYLKEQNLMNKQELDFSFIEDLVTGKRKLIVTNEETKNSFEIRPVEKKKNTKSIIFFALLIILVFIGNVFTIINYKEQKDTRYDVLETVDTLTLKNIVIIKNSALPNKYDYYINEKLSDNIIKDLTIDTSSVNIDNPGMYTYTIKYNNKEYVGVVIVVNNEQEKNQTIDQLTNPDKYTK